MYLGLFVKLVYLRPLRLRSQPTRNCVVFPLRKVHVHATTLVSYDKAVALYRLIFMHLLIPALDTLPNNIMNSC